MTDEEKAKKYAITRTYPKFETSYIANFVLREVEGAFLAGLKAGRPQWHKVADGDLPKNENDVLVYSGEEWRMCIGRYSPKNKAWEAGCDTVAWCEIPEYKGE